MLGSIRLGSLFGITIRCSWTFVLLLVLLVQWGGDVSSDMLLIGTLFVSVLLHELGHSLMARRFGIDVVDIVFWPLGGMARMSDIPESPRIEGWIALAGPAVNLVLAALGGLGVLLSIALAGSGAAAAAPLGALLLGFTLINLALGTLNLLPAFPMDGGRVLRAFLARREPWLGATERAVRIGRWVAGAMVVAGLLSGRTGLFFALALVAGFVWIMGARELVTVRLRHGRSPFGDAQPGAPEDTRARVHVNGHTRRDVRAELADDAASGRGGARRPVLWELSPWKGGGISDELVRQLETFRGPLRS